MESKKIHLKNSVVFSPITARERIIKQIEEDLSDEEIASAYTTLERADSSGLTHRISNFTWNNSDFTVILETGITHL